MHLLGRLYAFLYWSQQHSLLGLSLRAWLIALPLVLATAGMVRSWPLPAVLALAALAPILFVLYTVARRDGYKWFVPAATLALNDEYSAPRDEQHIPLQATGIFSLHDREDYVLARPAEYWRVPLGQHVFMVQERAGRFLYQIIHPEHVQRVEPGYLHYGKSPRKALALHFLVSWGPQFAYEPGYQYVGEAEEPEQVHVTPRILYLTFASDADRHAVWKSLLMRPARR